MSSKFFVEEDGNDGATVTFEDGSTMYLHVGDYIRLLYNGKVFQITKLGPINPRFDLYYDVKADLCNEDLQVIEKDWQIGLSNKMYLEKLG